MNQINESGDEFLYRLYVTVLILEKAGELITYTAKLTRLMQANAGDGSMYDKLGLTIYSTPHIDFDQAASLFEGLENSDLATVASHSGES